MSKSRKIICPNCSNSISIYKNPVPTVDIIIEIGEQIVLIERKNEPFGWAIPGGFVDYGEVVEAAAVREAREETCLDVELIHLLGVYSDPARDPRGHTISTVYVARANGEPIAADDAKTVRLVGQSSLPSRIVFDHEKILQDYFEWKEQL